MEAIAAAVPAWEPEHPTAPDQAAEDEARAEAEARREEQRARLPAVPCVATPAAAVSVLSEEQLAARAAARETALAEWAVVAGERDEAYKTYLKRMALEYAQQKEAILAVRAEYVEKRVSYLEQREAYRADKARKTEARVFLHAKSGEAMAELAAQQAELTSEGGASGAGKKAAGKKKK